MKTLYKTSFQYSSGFKNYKYGTSLADLAAYLLRRDVETAEKEGKPKYLEEKNS